VVPITTAPVSELIAPVPTADVMESIVPGTTGVPVAMPNSAAADEVISPTTPFIGTSGASFAGSSFAAATNSASYSVAPQLRLSHTSMPNDVDCVATTRPMSRAVR
jgi:hypothetical protein